MIWRYDAFNGSRRSKQLSVKTEGDWRCWCSTKLWWASNTSNSLTVFFLTFYYFMFFPIHSFTNLIREIKCFIYTHTQIQHYLPLKCKPMTSTLIWLSNNLPALSSVTFIWLPLRPGNFCWGWVWDDFTRVKGFPFFRSSELLGFGQKNQSNFL